MSDLIAETAEANDWILRVKAEYSNSGVFGRLAGSVIWSDETDLNRELLVPIDPLAVVADINENGFSLLKGHDPGSPLGRVLNAAIFTSPKGTKFISAVLGFYEGGNRLGFGDLGLEPALPAASPSRLPTLNDAVWIELHVDPKEVQSVWMDDVLKDAPLRIEQGELSHNAAEPLHELIRLGLPYAVLVWNPFVTAFATEAGKDAYAAVSRWVRKLFTKLAELRNPIVEIISHHAGCQVSYIIRGNNVKRHYAAHGALPTTAAKAAALVTNMKSSGFEPTKIVYEFDGDDEVWFPSYAELKDGRFVTDNLKLLAIEHLPSGLSLGLKIGERKSNQSAETLIADKNAKTD